MRNPLQQKGCDGKKQYTKGGQLMAKKQKIKVVYNTEPDPIVSIKEYEYKSDTGKPELVKVIIDKPEAGKTYQLTGKPGEKTIENGNTWKESEVNE